MHEKDIKTGKAEIYTAIEGSKVETFSIEITKVENERLEFIVTDKSSLKNRWYFAGDEWQSYHSRRSFCRCGYTYVCGGAKKGAALTVAEMLKIILNGGAAKR